MNPWYLTLSLRQESSRTILQRKADSVWTLSFPTKALIEAKAKTGNTKSSRTVMSHPEHYGKTRLIKIGDYNISEEGGVITLPHYLTFVRGKVEYDF